jgi:hypothetical protein
MNKRFLTVLVFRSPFPFSHTCDFHGLDPCYNLTFLDTQIIKNNLRCNTNLPLDGFLISVKSFLYRLAQDELDLT